MERIKHIEEIIMEISILDYLNKENIFLGSKQKNKRNTISAMIDHLVQNKKISKEDKKEIVKAIVQREAMGSTAIGNYIALPHARLDLIKGIIICLGIFKEGVDFDSLDQEPVYVIALLLSNQKEAGLHLKVLAFLARLLRDKYLVQKLKNAKSEDEILDVLNIQQQALR